MRPIIKWLANAGIIPCSVFMCRTIPFSACLVPRELNKISRFSSTASACVVLIAVRQA